VEGSPKRHTAYLTCVSDLHLENGLKILQSLSSTRWAARSINLRIVHRCLQALLKFLDEDDTSESNGLSFIIKDVSFIFGLEFLKDLFMTINTTSTALQASEIDLSVASMGIENLKAYVTNLRQLDKFAAVYATAIAKCNELHINIMNERKAKRQKKLPAALKQSVLSSFVSRSADACDPCTPEEDMKNELRLDFYYPVIDTLSSSLSTRFNAECLSVLKNIAPILNGEDFDEAIKQLATIAQIDSDECLAEARQLFTDITYKNINSLQSLANIMIERKHSILYKNFFHLIVFLLTLPVTSASCERVHSKVDLVKSAVRSSMCSDRLENLVLISSEKTIVDSLDVKTVIDRFALIERALPL
jgi:hypothetical protein